MLTRPKCRSYRDWIYVNFSKDLLQYFENRPEILTFLRSSLVSHLKFVVSTTLCLIICTSSVLPFSIEQWLFLFFQALSSHFPYFDKQFMRRVSEMCRLSEGIHHHYFLLEHLSLQSCWLKFQICEYWTLQLFQERHGNESTVLEERYFNER